jgi:hypothetical protein
VTDASKATDAAITLTNGTVQIVPAELKFATVKGSGRSSLVMTLTNTGSTALTMNSTNITGDNAADFSITSNSCGASLAVSANCNITIEFKAPQPGSYDAYLVISDSSADSPQKLHLTGMARAARFEVNRAAVNSNLAATKAPSVPPPTGPNVVGTRLLDLVDAKRDDPFTAIGAKRELLVRLWYPAMNWENCARAEYTSARCGGIFHS